jgi:HEAT repeat protein
MSKLLEQAIAAAHQGNWSLLNQCLRQLPLSKNATDIDGESTVLNDAELSQVLNLALDALHAGDFRERWDVAKVFPKLGERAIAPLIEILEDDEAELEVRWFVARVLAEFNHPTVTIALVNLLKNVEDEDLAAIAATALSSLGDSAIDALTDLLADPQTRLLATSAMCQIHRPKIIEPLLSVVGDSQVEVRSSAIAALGSFHDARIPPVLLEALEDSAAAVRKEAAMGLGLRSDLWEELDLLNHLKPLLYDFNPEVCQKAAIALARSRTDEAAEALFEVLKSPATPVPLQIDFVRALGWVGTATALDYLQQALAHVSVEGIHEIVRVLGRIEQPVLKTKAAKILLDFSHSEHPATTSATLKQAVAQAWGQLGELTAMDALVRLLADAEDSVKLHAIAALKNFPTARQQLEQLVINENLTPALKEGVAIALAEWQV